MQKGKVMFDWSCYSTFSPSLRKCGFPSSNPKNGFNHSPPPFLIFRRLLVVQFTVVMEPLETLTFLILHFGFWIQQLEETHKQCKRWSERSCKRSFFLVLLLLLLQEQHFSSASSTGSCIDQKRDAKRGKQSFGCARKGTMRRRRRSVWSGERAALWRRGINLTLVHNFSCIFTSLRRSLHVSHPRFPYNFAALFEKNLVSLVLLSLVFILFISHFLFSN